jgi:cytidylate kinase
MGQDSKIENKVIAIDGLSASGKTRLATELAKLYKVPFLLTGNLYRALALKLLKHDVSLLSNDQIKAIVSTITLKDLELPELKSETISLYSSKIAKDSNIRDLLNAFQHTWIISHKISIVEGRDIGTVIWPNAVVKLFITASPEIRAQRRFSELYSVNNAVTYENVLENIQKRDATDLYRKIAPLKKANDAILIDTTNKTIENVLTEAAKIIEKKIDNIEYTV